MIENQYLSSVNTEEEAIKNTDKDFGNKECLLDKNQNEYNNSLDSENFESENNFVDNKNPQEEFSSKKKNKILDILWYAVFSLVFLITIATCCSVAIFDCYIVEGISMLGTVKSGDRVSVCVWDKAKVGDVIVIKKQLGNNKEMLLIKRYIAKGPAKVKIDSEGNVYVNDLNDENNLPTTDEKGFDMLYEPYVLPENKSRWGSGGLFPELDSEDGYFVEEGKIFYLGDNRAHSTDSRSEGAVDESLIIGKVSDYSLKIKDKKIYKFLNNYYVDKFKNFIKRRK